MDSRNPNSKSRVGTLRFAHAARLKELLEGMPLCPKLCSDGDSDSARAETEENKLPPE